MTVSKKELVVYKNRQIWKTKRQTLFSVEALTVLAAVCFIILLSACPNAGEGNKHKPNPPAASGQIDDIHGDSISTPWACLMAVVSKVNSNECAVYMRYWPSYINDDTGQPIELTENDIMVEFLVGTGAFNPNTWKKYSMVKNPDCSDCGMNLEYSGSLDTTALSSGTKVLCRIRFKKGQWLYCYKKEFNAKPVPLSEIDNLDKFTLGLPI